MPGCPTCGSSLRRRGIVAASMSCDVTRTLWECGTGRHKYAARSDTPAVFEPWTGSWWPQAGTRPDLEADRPPHWG